MNDKESHLLGESYNRERISDLLDQLKEHKRENREDNEKMYGILGELLKSVNEAKQNGIITHGELKNQRTEIEALKDLYKIGVDDYRREFTEIKKAIKVLDTETEIVRFYSKNKALMRMTVIGIAVVFGLSVLSSVKIVKEFINNRPKVTVMVEEDDKL